MLITLSERNFIKIQYGSYPLFPVAYPFRIATQLRYYVKREKCKVNDVILPSGCEARAINLGKKNVKIGIFTDGTSVRSKNIFTDISRYHTGKHEIKILILLFTIINLFSVEFRARSCLVISTAFFHQYLLIETQSNAIRTNPDPFYVIVN